MEASCSVRMVQPFVTLAAANESLRDLVPSEIGLLDRDARVPLRPSQEVIAVGSERMKDPTLGLKLGQMLCFGMAGAFDYAVRSAATVRDSLVVAGRYSKLIAEPFHITVEARRRQTVIRFDDEVPWSKATADFALSAWYRTHSAEELPKASRPECWFPSAAPADTTEYERTFPGARLKFGAPFLGIAFDRAYENAPLPVFDPVLHAMLCARADSLVTDLSRMRALTLAVRRSIAQLLREGKEPTAHQIARSMRMSRRTFSRRLEQEGTTFADEFDNYRRKLALAYVRQSTAPLTEVAFQLGFSHVESFHRAFKRWTGNTPLAYRQSGDA